MSHSYPTLLPYGWSGADHLPPGTQPARILRHDGASLLAATSTGPRALLGPAHLDPVPTVGDWVLIAAGAPPDDSGHSIGQPAVQPVLAVLPRRSLLRRQSAQGRADQALAANVDFVLITCGVDRPVKPGRIQRLAAQAWDSGATPVLILTKVTDHRIIDVPRVELEHPGLRVFACAAREGVGLTPLRDLLAGRTAVLVGESGAGKSTLTNALLGSEVADTAAVRPGDAKGRHTTTARHLFLLPGPTGGSIIDTPGIRAIGLAAAAEAVDAVFPDIEELAGDCRFSDCAHGPEPGCAVQVAVEEGGLQPERLDGWRRLQREVVNVALRATPHEHRAQGRRFGRMAKEAQARKRG